MWTMQNSCVPSWTDNSSSSIMSGHLHHVWSWVHQDQSYRTKSVIDAQSGYHSVCHSSDNWRATLLNPSSEHLTINDTEMTWTRIESYTKYGRDHLTNSIGFAYTVSKKRTHTTDWHCSVRNARLGWNNKMGFLPLVQLKLNIHIHQLSTSLMLLRSEPK